MQSSVDQTEALLLFTRLQPVVINVDLDVIVPSAFTMLVIMASAGLMVTTPALRAGLRLAARSGAPPPPGSIAMAPPLWSANRRM